MILYNGYRTSSNKDMTFFEWLRILQYPSR